MSRHVALNFTLKALAAVVVAATLALVGAAVYGALYDAAYHGNQPGDVAVQLGRSGGVLFYVQPWVKTVYDWSMVLVLGGAVLLVAAAQLSKWLARKN